MQGAGTALTYGFSVADSLLSFQDIYVDLASSRQNVTILNRTDNAITIDSAFTSDPECKVIPVELPVTVDARTSRNIAVQFNAESSGAKSSDIFIDYRGRLQRIGHATATALAGKITVPYTNHDFGYVRLGNSVVWDSLVISSRLESEAHLEIIPPQVADYTLMLDSCSFDLVPGEDLSIPIMFSPVIHGLRQDSLCIMFGNIASIPVMLEGTGLDKILNTVQESIDFGALITQSTSEWKTISFYNDSRDPVAIDSIGIRNTDFEFDASDTPFVLPPYDNFRVEVRSCPQSPGAKQDQLLVYANGSTIASNIINLSVNAVPAKFTVNPNYPNPFNATTTIRYSLPEQARVAVSLYSVTGQEIFREYVGIKPLGEYTFVWDGTNDAGVNVPSGVYFCRVTAGNSARTQKMLLIK